MEPEALSCRPSLGARQRRVPMVGGVVVENTDSLALPWAHKSQPPEGGPRVWNLTRPRAPGVPD